MIAEVLYREASLDPGYDGSTQVSSVPPMSDAGVLRRAEGDRLTRRALAQGRNDGLFAGGLRRLAFEVRERMAARATTRDGGRDATTRAATAAFREWARDVGHMHQRGTLDQVFSLAINALLHKSGAWLHRVVLRSVAADPGDPHRNGLFFQVFSQRDVAVGHSQDGHEFDANGRYQGTWFRGTTPDDFRAAWTPTLLNARDLIELRIADDSSATRGVSWGASAVKPSVEIQLADEARLDAERANSTLSAIAIASPPTKPIGGRHVDVGPVISTADGVEMHDVESGTIGIARGVESIVFSRASSHQTSESSRVARLAAGLGLPVQAVTHDLTDTSFSSAKMGERMLQTTVVDIRERAAIQNAKDMLLRAFLQREVELGNDWTGLTWTWAKRSRIAVDPKKEAEADHIRLEDGLVSQEELIEDDGRDPGLVRSQRDQETRGNESNDRQTAPRGAVRAVA